MRATDAEMTLIRQVAELVASPCSAQSSPPILSSFLFSFPDILCCALCGDRPLVRSLGPTTVCSLRQFPVFLGTRYLTNSRLQHRWEAEEDSDRPRLKTTLLHNLPSLRRRLFLNRMETTAQPSLGKSRPRLPHLVSRTRSQHHH